MEKKKNTQHILDVFVRVYKRLPSKRKKQFWLLLVYMIIASTIATIAAGAIALFATAFSSQEEILDLKVVAFMQNIFRLICRLLTVCQMHSSHFHVGGAAGFRSATAMRPA